MWGGEGELIQGGRLIFEFCLIGWGIFEGSAYLRGQVLIRGFAVLYYLPENLVEIHKSYHSGLYNSILFDTVC